MTSRTDHHPPPLDRSGRHLELPDYSGGAWANRALFLETFHILIDQGIWTDEEACARWATIQAHVH